MKTEYLSCADTAKLIRTALKRSFPGIKFSVKSHVYSGGASINVDWTDGPTGAMVESVAKAYQGGRFDGMIDLAISVRHWMKPDGSIFLASNPGTEDNGGSIPAEREWMPSPDCKLVHFGANHVFCNRRVSDKMLGQLARRMVRKGYADFAEVEIRPASQWSGASFQGLSYEAENMAYRELQRFMVV